MTDPAHPASARIAWIDNARFLAIAAVVFGHTYALAPTESIRYVYSFHLAVFWFLSGMLLKPAGSVGKGLRRAFARLMVPYFFLGALIFGYRVLVAFLTSASRALEGKPDPYALFEKQVELLPGLSWRLLLNLETPMTMPLWFLAGLFLVSVLFLLAGNRKGVHLALVLAAIGLAWFSWHPEWVRGVEPQLLRRYITLFGVTIPYGFVLYSAGYWTRGWLLPRSRWLGRLVPVLLLAQFGAFLVLPIGSLLAKFVLAFLGVAAVFALSMLLPRVRPALTLGRASLVVLGLHEVFFDMVYRANHFLTGRYGVSPFFTQRSPTITGQLASSLTLTVLALLLSLPAIALLERYVPWGLGRRKARTRVRTQAARGTRAGAPASETVAGQGATD